MKQSSSKESLIQAIHESELRLALTMTGGGSSLISDLLAVPGGSKTVLEAHVPYSEESLARFLGDSPAQFCAPETTQRLAVQTYFNTIQTYGRGITAVACTAALATDRPKKGEHRFFKSIQSANHSTLLEVTLDKGKRTRQEEEKIIVELALAELGQLIGWQYEPEGILLADVKERQTVEVSNEWADVFHGDRDACLASRENIPVPQGVGILAGSFNPLHAGHLEMAERVQKLCGLPVHFELSVRNADKPPIDFVTMHERAKQFADFNLWLTQASTFVEKSRIFPGNVFVVGVDTMARIANPKYYPQPDGIERMIEILRLKECRFVVLGRLQGNRFLSLDSLELNPRLRQLCEGLSESDFRVDISSTELRNKSNRH